MSELHTASLWLVASSVAAGAAVFTAVQPLLRAILAPQTLNYDTWHRSQPRWQRLRETSSVFRSFERWIVGIGILVEHRLPWFLELPEPEDPHSKLAVRLFQVVFGQPRKLDRAVRIGNSVQPWRVGEILAAAWLLSAVVAGLAGLLILGSTSLGYCLLIGSLAGWLAYRVALAVFVVRAEQRRRAIRKFLPHAMDTIAMVISSGDPFRAGLDTVISDFPSHPLSQEFMRLRGCLDRGQTMSAALDEITMNVGLPEFDELTRVLSRVHDHGVPAAENFARLAKQLRLLHLRHLEEEVGRSEAAIALPTMLVLISCMMVATAPFLLSMPEMDLFK